MLWARGGRGAAEGLQVRSRHCPCPEQACAGDPTCQMGKVHHGVPSLLSAGHLPSELLLMQLCWGDTMHDDPKHGLPKTQQKAAPPKCVL